MSLTQQMEQVREERDQENVLASEESSLQSKSNGGSNGRRNPPARNTSRFWFERFLAIIQRQNPTVIDVSFLSQIAPSNEGKLLAQLKFLRVIDDLGKPTALLPFLNLVGDEQKKGFRQMVEQSYGELLAEVKVEKAVSDDLVNFFIRKYSFTRDKALHASKFFLYVGEKASIQLSQELLSFYAEKNSGNPSLGPSGQQAAQKAVDRAPRVALREARIPFPTSSTLQRSGVQRRSKDQGQYLPSAIQATIEIKLDKDTPREYWDRVLALLGEKRIEQTDNVESPEPGHSAAEGKAPESYDETSNSN